MKKACKHSLKRIYFRKLNKKTGNHDWITIDMFYCEKCRKVLELKEVAQDGRKVA